MPPDQPLRFKLRHTFLTAVNDADSSQGEESTKRRRASSAPPSVYDREEADEAVAMAVYCRRYGQQISTISSSMSSASQESNGAEVVVSGVAAPRRMYSDGTVVMQAVDRLGPACLSDLLYTRQAGLESFGTYQHDSGNCRTCVFESRHHNLGTAPCFKGYSCEFCHADHDLVDKKGPSGHRKKNRRAGAARHKKSNELRNNAENDEGVQNDNDTSVML
eukprot:gnl/TRDRNA2_/TRDRNA2_89168_c1_seq1.p1 gnl/TRDRNA2_/TRDRNA2_89168_c1~~gnl/TRDRNA2_/TRDRNA2_89168_c1_seq1.p1  ORF type:complete len:233 (+),score=29.16 gnl/TRDRNA2_/TRDRNA2_89168_c1_seq1:44-700(+)